VNAAHLALKMRKMREDHEDEEMENGELNLVPYLDIVTNVIMFLMMTTTFAAALADINVSAPTTSAASSASPSDQQNQDLNLTVSITERGFTIAASGAVLYQDDVPGKVPTIPKLPGTKEYDYTALTKKMRQIKDNFESETKVIINANNDITYETVVAAMDSIRQDASKQLFPDVLLSAGVN
jgi:biopolymer transport protein ExbD